MHSGFHSEHERSKQAFDIVVMGWERASGPERCTQAHGQLHASTHTPPMHEYFTSKQRAFILVYCWLLVRPADRSLNDGRCQ